ncbi:MAG TPA: rod-binding protein [Phycisphaerae bacterium]|nr:rod-binding protein [Phycisphaerae bacterium]HNU46734.1 rod-binding protein [Phycisphaerae bacterium]
MTLDSSIATLSSSATTATAARPAGAGVTPGEQRLRAAAGEVVGAVFFAPLLAQMRAGRWEGKFGHGGRGEEIFRGQLDAHLAAELGKSTQFPLADTLFARYAKQTAALSAQATTPRMESIA